jgi:hypothetical protein
MLRHCLLKRAIPEPDGIDLFSGDVIHEEHWMKNMDYFDAYCVESLPKGVRLRAIHLQNPVYFDWKTWSVKDKFDPSYQRYDYMSGRIDFVGIDLYKPGRLICMAQIPQDGGVFGFWVYEEHDLVNSDRELYFELDIIESEPSRPGHSKGAIFTDWNGRTQQEANRNTKWLRGDLCGWHYPELIWDGMGGFIWRLDGVRMKSRHLDVPKDLNPKVIFTLGVPHPIEYSEVTIKWAKYVC